MTANDIFNCIHRSVRITKRFSKLREFLRLQFMFALGTTAICFVTLAAAMLIPGVLRIGAVAATGEILSLLLISAIVGITIIDFIDDIFPSKKD